MSMGVRPLPQRSLFAEAVDKASEEAFDDAFLAYARRAIAVGVGLPADALEPAANGARSVPNGAQSVSNGSQSVPNGAVGGLGAALERGYAAPTRSLWEKDVSEVRSVSSMQLREEEMRRDVVGQRVTIRGAINATSSTRATVTGVVSNPPQFVVQVEGEAMARLLPADTTIDRQPSLLRAASMEYVLTVPQRTGYVKVLGKPPETPSYYSIVEWKPDSVTLTKTDEPVKAATAANDLSGLSSFGLNSSIKWGVPPADGLTGGPVGYRPYQPLTGGFPDGTLIYPGPNIGPGLPYPMPGGTPFDGNMTQEEVAAAMELFLKQRAERSAKPAAPKEPEKEEKFAPLPGKKAVRRLIDEP